MKKFTAIVGGSLGVLGVLSLIGILIAACYGWIMNIITLVGMPNDFTIELVARVVGTFIAPLGAILGYI